MKLRKLIRKYLKLLQFLGFHVVLSIALLLFAAALLWAAAYDVATLTIPNEISVGVLATFIGAALAAQLSWAEVALHLGAGLLLLIIGMLMFARGWLGGGDAKLMAATALWIGWTDLGTLIVWVTLTGGALAMLLLMFRRVPLPAPLMNAPWLTQLHAETKGVPYAVAIAAGALITLPQSVWIARLAA